MPTRGTRAAGLKKGISGRMSSFGKIELPGDLSCESCVDLRCRTKKSWSRERRVAGKAAVTQGKLNTHFILKTVISSPAGRSTVREEIWRTGSRSSHSICSPSPPRRGRWPAINYGSIVRPLLTCSSATCGGALKGARLACATVGTIRLRRFKIAAQLTLGVHRLP